MGVRHPGLCGLRLAGEVEVGRRAAASCGCCDATGRYLLCSCTNRLAPSFILIISAALSSFLSCGPLSHGVASTWSCSIRRTGSSPIFPLEAPQEGFLYGRLSLAAAANAAKVVLSHSQPEVAQRYIKQLCALVCSLLQMVRWKCLKNCLHPCGAVLYTMEKRII